ncbi:MAG: GNAT family N-acetyltransferase [Bacteroidales bacterium]|nr:GNAT family N-acetyltransferase [Bacteroidales bacterium]
MIDLIPPIPKKELEKELKKASFLRGTNYGGNVVYITTHKKTPLILKEIGRLREWTFRNAGGGTGKDCDLDSFDTAEDPYQQLFVWNPNEKEIIGGYRFYYCNPKENEGSDYSKLATAKLFKFSEKFINRYLPHLMELGRSFVTPTYQSASGGRKSMFALDNLWDGLGALVINHPKIRFFFGKVTMYKHFNKEARNMIQYFLNKHFKDHEGLLIPYSPLQLNINTEKLKTIFTGKSSKENYKILTQEVRKLGENIPPLINAYMNLSPTMKTFGTVINHHFGDVEETGIMITLKDMYVEKINRHLASYQEDYIFPSK